MNFVLLYLTSWISILFSLFDKIHSKKINLDNRKLPGVSVLIPTHNNGDTIYKCVNSVIKAKYPKLEIIVVNDGSTDNTIRNLNSFKGKIKIINQKHSGKSVALNTGVNYSKYPFVFILDADTFIDKYCLNIALSQFDDSIGAVTCKCVASNKGFWPSMENIGLIFESIFTRFQNVFQTVFAIRGCGTAIRKSALISVNGFDSTLKYCEDSDFGLKLLERGWKVKYETSAIVKTTVHSNPIKWFIRRIKSGNSAITVISHHSKTFLKRSYLLFPFVNYIFLLSLIGFLVSTNLNPPTLAYIKTFVDNINNFYILSSFLFITLINFLSSFYSYLFSYAVISLLAYFYIVSKIENENLVSFKIIPYLLLYTPLITSSLAIGYLTGIIKVSVKKFIHVLLYTF